jgi:hypothetical protein
LQSGLAGFSGHDFGWERDFQVLDITSEFQKKHYTPLFGIKLYTNNEICHMYCHECPVFLWGIAWRLTSTSKRGICIFFLGAIHHRPMDILSHHFAGLHRVRNIPSAADIFEPIGDGQCHILFKTGHFNVLR